jgi:hypothetical protein
MGQVMETAQQRRYGWDDGYINLRSTFRGQYNFALANALIFMCFHFCLAQLWGFDAISMFKI